MTLNLLIAVSLGYVTLLFAVAFWAERRAARGQTAWLRSPLIYTLSLSVYCTAWTFYGAVGFAARSGLEFLTIYLGPTIVFIGWWWLLRKLVRIGRMQRITSVADLISSRYGKSNTIAILVTILAVTGTTPYIALQLQSVTLSFSAFAGPAEGATTFEELNATAFWVAVGLAVFTVIFGTRNLDTNERHHGVVIAIAVEAVVKLVALLAVGIFVVWGVGGGLSATFARIDASPLAEWRFDTGRWLGLTALSAMAVICLPRMFQVLVVENSDERHLSTAAWAFPLYLLLMSLFVVPIAVAGLAFLPTGSNPDLFVLTLPLASGQGTLAMLAFLGGFSSATSMVIVASIALSTMVSNHIVMPIWLSLRSRDATISGDVRNVVILSRRISIAAMLALGWAYFRFSGGGEALAAIGLVSFVGVAQAMPALIGGIFWRGATRYGAAAGLIGGFLIWGYTLFLPSFGEGVFLSANLLSEGPFGAEWLRPQALLGTGGLDPLVHALIWSMTVNTLLFLLLSLLTFPTPMERFQGAQMVNAFNRAPPGQGWRGSQAGTEDLLVMSQRILGAPEAQAIFTSAARQQGKDGILPDATPDFMSALERELSGAVGGAAAHAMISQITGGAAVSVEDLLKVADETQQIMEYSSQLEAKSDELALTARRLRDANAQLTGLSVQKDAFLSQISHELRTPMTSIRAFSEILRDSDGVSAEDRARYATIIQEESLRLTRLLDDLLDLSVLENGQVVLNLQRVSLGAVLDRSVTSATAGRSETLNVRRSREADATPLLTDSDRLSQVVINLISNAEKYCKAAAPELHIRTSHAENAVHIDFIDNGHGIPPGSQDIIFEKFSRLTDESAAGSAGLGLAICREIMTNLGGSIAYLPGQGGTAFRVTLPV